MTDPTNFWDLKGKMREFGLTDENYREEIRKFPKIRIPVIGSNLKYTWCQDNLNNNWIWNAPFQRQYVDMYFKYESDAIIFKLKFKTVHI